MADEMSDCLPAGGSGAETPQRPAVAAVAAMNELPTLQRNALRKIFDRPQFTPDEVAALGYRRLQQAEGIGSKGLASITDWLRVHGHELTAPPQPTGELQAPPRKSRRTIEMAVRLLRTHGYEVQPSGTTGPLAKGQ